MTSAKGGKQLDRATVSPWLVFSTMASQNLVLLNTMLEKKIKNEVW